MFVHEYLSCINHAPHATSDSDVAVFPCLHRGLTAELSVENSQTAWHRTDDVWLDSAAFPDVSCSNRDANRGVVHRDK